MLSPQTIERRVQRMRQQLAEGGDVARSVLRELFPHSIMLEPDESGRHLRAVFADDFDACRISLLYETTAERIEANTAAMLAAIHKRLMVAGAGFGTTESNVVCFSGYPLRSPKTPPDLRIPATCGHGHSLSPENLRIDRSEQRWRCLQCGAERAAAFRRRRRQVR